MRSTGMSKLYYLLSALLMFALTGCGASNLANLGSNNTPGSITAKMVWSDSKTAAKSVALLPAGVASLSFTVTGTDVNGNALPVVRNLTAIQASDAAGAKGTVTGIYPGSVSLVAKALDSKSNVVYEGVVTSVTVVAGGQTDIGTINMSPPVEKAQDQGCIKCHETTLDSFGQNLVADFKQSGHYTNSSWTAFAKFSTATGPIVGTGCAGCHGPSHNDHDPVASGRCAQCHGPTVTDSNHAGKYIPSANPSDVCSTCHNSHNPLGPFAGGSCVACHAFPQDKTARGNYVNDNSGVRTIVAEFSKRSHHIVGGAPHDEQCAVCHLEGMSVNGKVTINTAYHMTGPSIYLRNVDTDAPFVWSGTEHSNMDNFCFSCHDSDGATSAGVAAIMTGKNFGGPFSPRNPFADTLTNGYDQVARAGVVDVKTAFTTTNASHHAVSGQRYQYRFSTLANAQAWAARTGNPVPAASDIAEGHVVNGVTSPFGTGLTYDPAGPEEGGDATLFEAGKFVTTYIPLGAALTVGDNSTLHCGDCHTVGQWKAGSSTNAAGNPTPVAIGAHGANNEYLLRNSLGTDALHNNLTYVCFDCHQAGEQAATAALWAEKVADGLIANSVAPTSGSALNPTGKYIVAAVPSTKAGWNALHPAIFAGQFTGYATSHAVSAMHAQCLADSADNLGNDIANGKFANMSGARLQRSWMNTGVKIYDYLPAAGATAAAPLGGSDASAGNITGIACTNCHNSGLRNGFGGIHGGNNTYTDGLGRTQTTYRFMPGMGNYRYAPPGGWDNKDVSDPTLLTQHDPVYPGTPGSRTDMPVGYPGPDGKPMGGCYTNGTADLNVAGGVAYSACNHHGTSTATQLPPDPSTPRPTSANFRHDYNGGTAGNPTTNEPTVREATAGGTLVTRPLKY